MKKNIKLSNKFNISDTTFEDLGFDERVYEMTLENSSISSKEIELAKRYVEKFDINKNIGLILSGNVGTGKTYIALAIANALIREYKSVKVTRLEKIFNYMTNFKEDKNKYLSEIKELDLLIIDDFSYEKDSDFFLNIIFEIINIRYESMKPLILTTNLPLTVFINNSNLNKKRINTRILEMCYPVRFNGENLRLKKSISKMKKFEKEIYQDWEEQE